MEWKNILRGLAMGTSDLIPGVSGGTIAVILGIYDRFISAISGFFSREWKKHLLFLLPIAIGMGIAILGLSRLIEFLLEDYPAPTQFFFIGLIIGIIPMLAAELRAKSTIRISHGILFVVAFVLVASMAFIQPAESAGLEELTAANIILLFFSGWLASMAMLMPGISGSFVLLIIGVYPTVISALSELNLAIIAIVGLGVVIGFIVSSKLIRYLLHHFPGHTFAVILGLVAGSLFVVFPGLPQTAGIWIASIITLAAGFIAVHWISKYA